MAPEEPSTLAQPVLTHWIFFMVAMVALVAARTTDKVAMAVLVVSQPAVAVVGG